MSLLEFLTAHRTEIAAACRSELENGARRIELERAWEILREVAGSLEPGFEPDAAGGPFPTLRHGNAILGRSPAMVRVRTSIDQLSRRSRAPVLISGEVGTGRRHCALALHAATYPDGPLLELDGATLVDTVEQRVAALGVRASAEAIVGLTLYVHELTEAPPAVRTLLAKLLKRQDLPFRVVVSSSEPLAPAARARRLRADLAFRFANELKLPPLSERLGDIADLVRYFSWRLAAQAGVPPTTFSPAAQRRLQQYSWPGNLTELAGTVERLSAEFGAHCVEAEDIPPLAERASGIAFNLPTGGIDLGHLERELLTQALAMADNNQTRAASLLGLTRDQIRYRMSKFEVAPAPERSGLNER